jgi:hypothetical protein
VLVTYEDRAGPGEPAASGVDTSTLRVFIDDVDRTPLFTVRPDDASVELPDTLALAAGEHTVRTTISDRAGNSATGTSTFVVDATPPTIQVTAPSAGAFLNVVRNDVRVTYQDDRALNLGSLRISINGIDRTAEFTVGTGEATATLDLPTGANQIAASISDQAGNPGIPAAAAFNVDTTPTTRRSTSRRSRPGSTALR